MCICVCTYMCVHIHVCMCRYTRVCVYIYMCVCVHIHVYVCVHIHVCTYTCVHTRVCMCTYMCVCIHMCMCVYIHRERKIRDRDWFVIRNGSYGYGSCCSVDSVTLLTAAHQVFLSFSTSPSPWVCSNSCPLSQWYHPTNSFIIPFSCLQFFPASGPFSNKLALCIKWPKYCSFNFIISPSNEYSGLILLRIDWFDLLAIQRTPKSLLQHHSPKALILQHSAIFVFHLSHPYKNIGKTIALAIWTFVGKVMSLLFNMLSSFVIAFLPGNKHLNFMAAVTVCSNFAAQADKIWHCYHSFT